MGAIAFRLSAIPAFLAKGTIRLVFRTDVPGLRQLLPADANYLPLLFREAL